ncbi:MAG: 30S ribosomal protein S17 [Parcubacteria group bacterium RIFOXYD2_FULL_52_8]|nr:MAG: 30S ribosomal protein S17 [Parcubacteria group bacterium RIFOXYD2_FULL_52_8]
MTQAIKKSTTGMQLEGVVVSDKMQSTAVVLVNRFVKHAKYGKFLKISKRYKAHNPDGTYKAGDKVRMQSCRPISKDKHFTIIAKTGHVKGDVLARGAVPEAVEA